VASLTEGRSFDGRFMLLRRLGAGGMSEVWLARDPDGREVALKVALPGVPDEHVAQLEREWNVNHRLDHPGIVRALELVSSGDGTALVLEYVAGRPIERGLAVAEAVALAITIADALGHAHDRGVIHRDVKPANVLRDESGAARLLDFGIAASTAGAVDVRGGGSRPYVSPQQLDGEPPSVADDIYGLGCLLHEIVSGQPPLWPESTDERIRASVPPPLGQAGVVPARLRDLVADMLAKSPAARPATMTDVRRELEQIAGELAGDRGVAARPAPPPRIAPIAPAAPVVRSEGHAQHRTGWLTVALLGALVAIAVSVFVLLPRWVDGRAIEPTAVETAIVTNPAAHPPAASVDDETVRPAAEQALLLAMRRRRHLEAMAVTDWAKAEFELALTDMTKGDEALAARSFEAGRAAYAAAASRLAALESQAVDEHRRALEAGRVALAAGDSASAALAFGRALALAADDEEARVGLERSAVLDEVLAHVGQAGFAEERARLAEAEQAYGRALALDPRTVAARQGLARVRDRARMARFRRAMSAGLAAIGDGDDAGALEQFARAGALRPGDPLVADAVARVERRQTALAIAGHRTDAERAEREERWHDAAEIYALVLEIDSTLVFAQEGGRRARTRSHVAEQLQFHLDHPERLATPAVLDEAEQVLDRALKLEPVTELQGRQIAALEKLLLGMRTPIVVRLESDEQTEVTVHRVGRLGTFRARALELRPGTYAVVGRRRGYRDVRRELVVEAGSAPAPLVIRCEEPI